MKLTVTLYRSTSIPTKDLITIAGFDVKTAPVNDSESCYVLKDGTPLLEKALNMALREQFAPLAPRFKIFYPSNLVAKYTTIGIEVMSFDLTEAQIPQAGIVYADPISPQDIERVDGALESELGRLGLNIPDEDFDWKMAYETKGN